MPLYRCNVPLRHSSRNNRSSTSNRLVSGCSGRGGRGGDNSNSTSSNGGDSSTSFPNLPQGLHNLVALLPVGSITGGATHQLLVSLPLRGDAVDQASRDLLAYKQLTRLDGRGSTQKKTYRHTLLSIANTGTLPAAPGRTYSS
ncbi:hypothetical protein DL546_000828 [Coniochaeta pulveracea]|uniref:Uncharacterized protein n=1 Tax=Coniochaeta pulveracea TaxID=177199 RepID=A0A420Y9W0_9PEZI|nr:hypothetical protein DL546_000828 [Coniochaeta pulveracea]